MTSVGLLAPAAVADPPPPAPSYEVRIVNHTAVPAEHVFVTLTTGGSAPTLPAGMSLGTSYPLAASPGHPTYWTANGNAYSLTLSGQWTSGTILYSLGDPDDTDFTFTGYDRQPTVGTNERPYDFSEITFDSNNYFNGDISAVNQIGIPARLAILQPDGTLADRSGSTDSATEYVGCVDATKAVLDSAVSGWDAAAHNVWRTQSDGEFLQLEGLGSATIYPQYPSFEDYVESLAGQTLRVRGSFPGSSVTGNNAAYYDYTGVVGADGSVFLTGSLWDDADATGTTNYPTAKGIYAPGQEIYGHDPTIWKAGTGYGVYAQNGPYTVAGSGDATLTGGVWTGTATVPPTTAAGFTQDTDGGWVPAQSGTYKSVGNDVYGWIYGDLVVSYAMGYWGSNATGTALYDSQLWNTNPPPVSDATVAPYTHWWSEAGLPAYGDAWTGPTPTYVRYNIYQYATQTTGTTYGMSLGDRFAPAGAQNPEIGVLNAPDDPTGRNFYGTWQVELLSNTGCADPAEMTPTQGPSAGGQTVTITGRNIHRGATVTFDGVAATSVGVDVDGATGVSTVTAVTPTHTDGAVTVRVTNPRGVAAQGIDSSALDHPYTYTSPAPAPEATPTPAAVPEATPTPEAESPTHPPAEPSGEQCTVRPGDARPHRRALPVDRRVTLVGRVSASAGCALLIDTSARPQGPKSKHRHRQRGGVRFSVNESTGKVTAKAVRGHRVAIVQISAGDSSTWGRRWKSKSLPDRRPH